MQKQPNDPFIEALKRLTAGHSRKEIARAIGVTESALSLWFNGHNEPHRDNIFALEEFLGIRKGTLSRTLGYLPTDARPAMSTLDALACDPLLSSEARRLLWAMYRAATDPLFGSEERY